MAPKATRSNEAGIALMTTLLVLMLVSALMAGIFAAVQSDLREAATDRDQTQAYAAAHAGLEKLTSGLAELFLADVSPPTADIDAIADDPPEIPGFEYVSPGGGDGFTIDYDDIDDDGTPDILDNTAINTGPFAGFIGLITPYTMTVTARSTTGRSEVRLRRGLQTVAVPVFQFGMFSEDDLSIFAGGGFRFGGRVHTNGSLFVGAQTQAASTNITFNDRITAVNEVIRNYLSNGLLNSTSSPSFNNEVRIPTSSTTNAVFTQSPNMGSVESMPGSAPNTTSAGGWFHISTSTFKNYVRTTLTGARRLDLPLVSQGAEPVDLIRRPRLTAMGLEQTVVFDQRFFKQAGLRILLSDRAADITGLPTVAATPVPLDAWAGGPPTGYGAVSATRPPIARSIGPAATQTVGFSSGGTYSGGWAHIYVANTLTAIPDVYKMPNITVGTGGTAQLLTCEGKTGSRAVTGTGAISANRFYRCRKVGGGSISTISSGTLVTATVNGVVASANVTSTVPGGSSTTVVDIPVGADATAKFSPTNLLWINNANGRAVPVTCQGYHDAGITISGSNVAQRFLNCRGLTAEPGTNRRITTSALANQNTGTIGGFITIEKQTTPGTWVDVTMQILTRGIGDANSGGSICADPTPNAILRIQRLRDNGGDIDASNDPLCTYSQSQNPWDWWPQTLYDAREGSFRDSATSGSVHGPTSPMRMMGIIQYVALDVNNLKAWLAGPGSDTLNEDGNGYIVYFSDRRGNHNTTAGFPETGEFGFEDHINSTTAAGLPDGVLQAGENVNGSRDAGGNPTQELYGGVPWNDPANIPANGSVTAVNHYSFANARPARVIPHNNDTASGGIDGAGVARVNKVVLFRRALKLVNGGINGATNSLPTAGLTVASENPVYVHGNYNAPVTEPNANWTNWEPNVPAAIIADAITLLSRNWSDARSFEFPNDMPNRPALQTSYRFGAIAGKGLSFPYCGGGCGNPGHLFGTDGGAGNFFRLLEDWGATGATGSQTAIRYRGSIISLHVNRQAIGAYKFAASNNHIYNAGPRNFTYDVDFLIPAELPPGTPMFRDINTLQFRQILRPNQ